MRRITVEEVLEAYRVTGMKPGRGGYVWESHPPGTGLSADPMGVMLVNMGYDFNRQWFGEAATKEFGNDYARGFETGSNHRPWSGHCENQEQYDIGYADGQAVAAAVFQEQGA